MIVSDIVGVMGLLLAFVGLAYAVYQSREKKKLKEYIRSQAWYIYAKANNVAGIAQASLDAYKQTYGQNLDIQVLELMTKTNAFGQELFKETIRQIQLSEPQYDNDKIDLWIESGRVDKDHGVLFKIICVSDDGSKISRKKWL